MKLVQSFMTRNPCWTANVNKADSRYVTFQQRGPQGGMLHSVGCAQPSALVFINSWNKESYTYSCVHGIIDANDGTVYQLLKWDYRGWHGGGDSNNTHLGVEMCESKWIRYLQPNESGYAPAKFVILDKAKAQADCKRTYDAAVELFAMLAMEFGWNPDTDIISHKEGGQKGIASGHADPEHCWTQLGMPYTMNTFRAAVKAKMVKPLPFVDVPDGRYYTEAVKWAWSEGIVEGTDKTHFSPDKPCTRAQIVTMLKRYHDKFGGG